MKKNKLKTANFKWLLLAFIVNNSLFAQQPKLVVGIVVDQMRYDYLFSYSEKYGKGGFKRLLNEGFLCRNAQYNYVPTYRSGARINLYWHNTCYTWHCS